MALIRTFRTEDAQAVSELIRVTMSQSNTWDYPIEQLRPLMDYFSPAKICDLNRDRHCLVAEAEATIVGTAALEGTRLCTFFVHPHYQRAGIGTRLLAALEATAQDADIDCLLVEASLKGALFYERNGYVRTGTTLDGVAGPQIELRKCWRR